MFMEYSHTLEERASNLVRNRPLWKCVPEVDPSLRSLGVFLKNNKKKIMYILKT